MSSDYRRALRVIDESCAAYAERIADADRLVDDLEEGEARSMLVNLIEATDSARSTLAAGQASVARLEAWRSLLVQRVRDQSMQDYQASIEP